MGHMRPYRYATRITIRYTIIQYIIYILYKGLHKEKAIQYLRTVLHTSYIYLTQYIIACYASDRKWGLPAQNREPLDSNLEVFFVQITGHMSTQKVNVIISKKKPHWIAC